MNQLLTTIQTAFNTMMSAIVGAIQTFANQLKGFLDYLTGWVVALIRSGMDYIKTLAEGIINQVAGFIRDVVTKVQDAISQLITFAKNFFESVVNQANKLWEDIVKKIQAGYEQLISGSNAIINTVNERLGGLRESFTAAAEEIVGSLTGLAKEQLQPIKEALLPYLEMIMAAADKDHVTHLAKGFDDMSSGHSMALQSREDAQRYFTSKAPYERFSRWLFFSITVVAQYLEVYKGVAHANAQVVLQEFAGTYSYMLLSPPDAITVFRRGLISEKQCISIIHKQGYTEEDAVNMMAAATTLPNPSDMLNMWHRGLINDNDVNQGLKAQGFQGDWLSLVKEASFIHPPAQDLITMAVRDVFSPGTVERFQQMEDFPEAFEKEAKKAGLDVKWARNYWAAHWRLPSAEQGFEMFQRGVILEEDLNLLLKSLDIMPYWREKLTQISYNTLTRVDVRRMHKIGVMTDEELPTAYENIGYSPKDAADLADFTIELNKNTKSAPDEELGKLTKATILNFYEDGLINEDRAIELLVSAGYTPEAAQLLTNENELKVELRKRREELDHIVDLVKAGVLSASDAGDKLNALNLEQGELRKAETRILRATEKKVAIPSRTEGEKMVAAKIITLTDYKELLSLHGYAPKWVEAFVRLLGVKGGTAEA